MEELANVISFDCKDYEALIGKNSKSIFVKTNIEILYIPEKLAFEFINNQDYLKILEESLQKRINISVLITQNEEILVKKSYSPIAVVLAIKTLEDDLDNEKKRDFKVLLNRIDFKKYLSRNNTCEYSLTIDEKPRKIAFKDLFAVLFEEEKYSEFISGNSRYLGLYKEDFVYALETLFTKERLFLGFVLEDEVFKRYQYLTTSYDTYAINKYTKTDFEALDQIEINESFEKTVLNNVPSNISTLEKIMIIYSELHKYLRYDLELDEDESKVKKHKDFSRIVEISSRNNRVYSYEFSSLLAKFLSKMNINFEYNDKYLIVRVGIYVIKMKAITSDFNLSAVSETDILKGIVLQNSNKKTVLRFEKIYASVYKRLYKDKIDLKILKMPFKSSLDLYKLTSRKASLDFVKKYNILLSLIGNVENNTNAIGYIYEIKQLLFDESELNANISFATIAEVVDGNIEPVIIITINNININLYNSNKYIYYNPPHKVEIFDLKELRLLFFNGRFKYISDTTDSIIGVEKI